VQQYILLPNYIAQITTPKQNLVVWKKSSLHNATIMTVLVYNLLILYRLFIICLQVLQPTVNVQ